MSIRQSTILIVDDDPQVGSLIRNELSERGFICHVVDCAARAMELIDTEPPDALISDIRMPGSSGLDLLVHARKCAPQCGVVLITGHSNRQYLAQAMLLGAYDYIEKPFRSGELVEVVSRAVNCGRNGSVLLDRAIDAMEHNLNVRQTSLDGVGALVRAVEAKDPYTRKHSEQVAHYAFNLAGEIGLAAPEVESIRVASLLHDIGKIGVPDYILTKSGPLTKDEFQKISRHPALGSDILASITLLAKEARVVRHHHERWDGKGYPDGLSGEDIPFGARVIQVADSMDAMLMERTYKKGYSIDRMISELQRCSGMQFEPQIASAASRWCRGNPDKLILPGKDFVLEALSV